MDPKAYKQLRAKWYKKLKSEGFNDIEQDDISLKQWHSRWFYHRTKNTAATHIAEYYRAAGRFLHDYKFESDIDRTIWEQHSDGVTFAQITTNLKRKKVTHAYVQKTIERLRKIMLEKEKNRNDYDYLNTDDRSTN